ncbi:hypothetical protein JAAARDRAFT_200960 [Jaapia argillacea MUCL 33604]|uniref:Uncharacterized protein n=1 Tax=Jaapia argillacea MUCL 33604 TaxID=933084 RepID=A0A067PE85_9AGAM|nr:hypothetical protein JAAARDRAFT_200960 [Jaapia argillacea MUCL 33604]
MCLTPPFTLYADQSYPEHRFTHSDWTQTSFGVPIDFDFDDLVHKACDEDVVADLCETPHEDHPPPTSLQTEIHRPCVLSHLLVHNTSSSPDPLNSPVQHTHLPRQKRSTRNKWDKKRSLAPISNTTNLKSVACKRQAKADDVPTNLATAFRYPRLSGKEGL